MKELDAETVREIAAGFMQSKILLSAVELDLFSALEPDGKTAAQAAALVGADARATDRVLSVLRSMGLVEKSGDAYCCTATARKLLVKGSPTYMGNLEHMGHMWHSWSRLTECVRAGTSPDWKPGAVPEQGRAAFIAAMQHGASHQADDVVRGLDLRGVKNVLDVGAGSGGWTAAFVRAGVPRATAFDLPEVLALTRGYLERFGVGDRIDLVGGDYYKGDFPGPFDLVFMSSIIHINSPEENAQLVRRGAAALSPGGRLVVRDFIVGEDRTGPPHAVMFAINMLVNTRAGDTYTFSEIRTWMEAAGLRDVRLIQVPGSADLVAGTR